MSLKYIFQFSNLAKFKAKHEAKRNVNPKLAIISVEVIRENPTS